MTESDRAAMEAALECVRPSEAAVWTEEMACVLMDKLGRGSLRDADLAPLLAVTVAVLVVRGRRIAELEEQIATLRAESGPVELT